MAKEMREACQDMQDKINTLNKNTTKKTCHGYEAKHLCELCVIKILSFKINKLLI